MSWQIRRNWRSRGLGYAGVGRKGVGAGSSTPKGSDADNSISGVSLPGGICSLE